MIVVTSSKIIEWPIFSPILLMSSTHENFVLMRDNFEKYSTVINIAGMYVIKLLVMLVIISIFNFLRNNVNNLT